MFRVIGFSLFILVGILGLACSMFGIISKEFWIAVVVCALLIWWAYSRYRKLYTIIECSNCHLRMTYKRFRDTGGCPKCGTDLYTRASKQI